MLMNELKVLNTRKEKKTTPVKKSHFNETAKVVQQFIRDEESEDKKTSPEHRIFLLKKALGTTRDSESHHRIKKEIEDLELKIKFGEASGFTHTLPEDKADMIMENYRIEKAKAESDLADINSDVDTLEKQLTKIQNEIHIKKLHSNKLTRLLNEARAVQMAHDGKLTYIYYDDYPTLHFREKGLSELRDLRIQLLKEEN